MIYIEEGPIIKLLLSNHIDILIHGCTCQSSLPVGLGQEIEITFPEVGRAHWKHYINRRRAQERMVGDFSEYFYKVDKRKYGVINLYTQVWPGPDLREIKMREGLLSVFRKFGPIKKSGTPIRYGMPIIGAEFGMLNLDMFLKHLEKIESILSESYSQPFDIKVIVS